MVMAMVMVMATGIKMRANINSGICAQKLLLLGVAMSCIAFPVSAGDWKITPRITVNETATDNVALSSTNKKSELITDISPGISIDGSGGRSKLRFDYQMHNLIYAQDSSRNQLQNSLNALGTLEALENWFFIDASGNISQQSISAFSGSSASTAVSTGDNSNTTETSTYRISPYFRGALGNFADYQLRYNLSTTHSKTALSNDSTSRELVASLKGVTSLTNLGWSLDASSQTIGYSAGRDNENDRLRGVLTYQIDPQFRVSLFGGRESNNYQSLNKESHTTKGGGFDWSPTERTQISVSRENRFFGNSNSFSFAHRTEGSAWKYSESKDASAQANQQVGLGTYFERYSSICSSIFPNATPIQQATCVSNLLGPLPPNALLPGGFLTNGVTLQHRRELSFALLGARNTVTFAASQSESESLSQGAGTGINVGTGFSNVQNIRQRTASINWSHKLTGLSSLTGSYAHMNSQGTGTSTLETTQQMFNLNFTTQLGPKTNAGLGVRRVVVDGSTSYTENALTGVLSHQF